MTAAVPRLVARGTSRARHWWLPMVAAPLAFLAIHALLLAEVDRLDAYRAGHASVVGRLTLLAPPGSSFAGLALCSVVLAAAGSRRMWLLPPVLHALVGPFQAVVLGMRDVPNAPWPTPVGDSWWAVRGAGASWAHPALGAVVDLVLVLAPATALARHIPTRSASLSWPSVAGVGLSLTALWFLLVTRQMIAGGPQPLLTDGEWLLPLFALAAGAPPARRWFPWVHVLAPVLLSGVAAGLLVNHRVDGFRVEALGWMVAAVGAGLVRHPAARLVQRSRSNGWLAFWLVNLLNGADAVLTHLALRSGEAAEANPVVRTIGLGGKVVLVAAVSAVLLRYRPRALVLPMVALLGVLCVHASGLVMA